MKACRDWHVNSPARMNPKNPVQHAAQSIAALYWDMLCVVDQAVYNRLRISSVIGRRAGRCEAADGRRWIPRNT